MKQSEIEVGGRYKAKVNDNVVTVQVISVRDNGAGKPYWTVKNLVTGRTTVFRSAMKFRCRAESAPTVVQIQSVDQTAGKLVVHTSGGSFVVASRRGGQYTSPAPVVSPQEDKAVEEARQSIRRCGCPCGCDAAVDAGNRCPKCFNNHQGTTSALAAKLAPKSNKTAPHVIVEARAGSGKTTTLVEGLKVMKGLGSKLTPSPQQKAVWDAISLSRGQAQTVGFCAFNKSIAVELGRRVPTGCDAMTLHSLGYKSVARSLTTKINVTDWRVKDLLAGLLGKEAKELIKTRPAFVFAVDDLVGLVKNNLVQVWDRPEAEVSAELAKLASHYDVDLGDQPEEVFKVVPKVVALCKTEYTTDGRIDYNDMIWLPIVCGLPVFRYDLLLVDEAQDLNRCQQALAKRAGRRLILCGDPKQAIYGFAGADTESMPRMAKELGETESGCVQLPLTVTRRCGRRIVAEANRYVPDFSAHETCPEGLISTVDFGSGRIEEGSYHSKVADGDAILCRVNAPLVSQCFRFLKAGRKANIQGREVGAGLVKTVDAMKAPNHEVTTLLSKLGAWLESETAKEQAKKNPSDARLQNLEDRYLCLVAFAEGETTVDGVKAKIKSTFGDRECPKCGAKYGNNVDSCFNKACNKAPLIKPRGICLSSIHRSKGLEWNRVFFLRHKDAPIPHPMAKTPWAKEQEYNLLYVAITRAISQLVYITGGDDREPAGSDRPDTEAQRLIEAGLTGEMEEE